jgi:hypothetical protein
MCRPGERVCPAGPGRDGRLRHLLRRRVPVRLLRLHRPRRLRLLRRHVLRLRLPQRLRHLRLLTLQMLQTPICGSGSRRSRLSSKSCRRHPPMMSRWTTCGLCECFG